MPWKTKSTDNPNGAEQIWRLWRHCCCRYGWYPLLVAPIVTAGCLLDLYSSFDCRFIRVNVGFLPSNEAWNQTTADLGIFYFQSGEEETNKYRKALVEGCREYSDEFHSYFIAGDRTWEVARIMGFVSGIAATVATATIWIIVLTPIPACFFWPGVLLPSLMISFLAGGSKFLFFDTAICHSALWSPSGSDSQRLSAASCDLGTSGFIAIAAAATFFVTLLLVCLKAPKKRELMDDYCDYEEGDLIPMHHAMDLESEVEGGHPMTVSVISPSNRKPVKFDVDDYPKKETSHTEQPEHSFSSSFEGKSNTANSFERLENDSFFEGHDLDSDAELREPQESSNFAKANIERRDDISGSISKPGSKDSDESGRSRQLASSQLPPRPKRGSPVKPKISQARLTKVELLEHSHKRMASDELIEKCVEELTKSFQVIDQSEDDAEIRQVSPT